MLQRMNQRYNTSFEMRTATPEDQPQIAALLPQLADFDIPEMRTAEELWHGDLAMLKRILAGQQKESYVDVAVNEHDNVMGFVIITMREELMSHAPSAHLEVIVVHPDARGTGLGRQLMAHTEASTRERGAQSLSLHVFNKNERAKALYVSEGFDLELIRAIKWYD